MSEVMPHLSAMHNNSAILGIVAWYFANSYAGAGPDFLPQLNRQQTLDLLLKTGVADQMKTLAWPLWPQFMAGSRGRAPDSDSHIDLARERAVVHRFYASRASQSARVPARQVSRHFSLPGGSQQHQHSLYSLRLRQQLQPH